MVVGVGIGIKLDNIDESKIIDGSFAKTHLPISHYLYLDRFLPTENPQGTKNGYNKTKDEDTSRDKSKIDDSIVSSI